MPFITRLTLQSGDRARLDDLTGDLRAFVERKGAEFKGPHTSPPERIRVPLYRRLDGSTDRRYDPWDYTVYERRIEIVGHDEAARRAANWAFPPDVHVEVEVSQVRPVGGRGSGS